MELRRRAGAVASAGSAILRAAPAVMLGALVPLIEVAALAPSILAQTPEVPLWATLRQEVDIDLGAGDGSAEVRVRFELGAAEEGDALPLSEPVAFELLGFGDAVADEVVLLSRGDGRPEAADEQGGPAATDGRRIILWPTTGSHRVAVVEPPFETVGQSLEMHFSYRVENVVEATVGVSADERGSAGSGLGPHLHARIPILTGPPVRAAGGGEAFEAELNAPDGWTVTEGFPSGLDEAESGSWAVSLTVAPSVVGFRARTDGQWRPGFPLLIDALAVLILLGFAGVGWRHLRSVAAR